MDDTAMILEWLNKQISSLFGGESLMQKSKMEKSEFPLMTDLLPYRSYDQIKRLFINENSVGFILESTPLIGASEGTIDTLSSMFSDGIPEGCTIQFLNWASPKVGPIFEQWKQSRNAQGGIYKKLAEKRLEFFRSANHSSIFNASPFTIKNFRLVISVSISLKKKGVASDVISKFLNKEEEASLEEAMNQILVFKEKFSTTLRTAGMENSEMEPVDLINFLDEIINFNISPKQEKLPYDLLQPLNKQIVDPENYLKTDANQITIFADDEQKETQIRCFSVRNFPKFWAQWQCRDLIGDYFQDLRRMEYPFLTSFSVTLPYNEDALRSRAKAKNFNATRLSGSDISRFIPEMRAEASEWQFVNEKLNSGQKILKTFYQVLIFAPNKKINEAEQTIKSIYKGVGWDLYRDKYVNLQSFLAALPFTQSDGLFEDLEKLNRTKTMVSWTVANVAPLQGEWSGMNSPCMMLFGRRGQPLFWNPFQNKEGNYNVAVIGKSGSGKSVFMQDLVTSIRGFGGKVYVIDDGRSFMNSAKLQGGEFIEFSEKSKICLNPFSIVNEQAMKENPEYRGEVIGLIRSMIRQMCEGVKKNSESISEVQDRYIQDAVQKVWDLEGKDGSISLVKEFFEKHENPRANDLAILVSPFAKGGIYERFFEGQSNIKLDNPFMVFELAELKNKKEFQSIVLMFLIFLVANSMYFGDRKTPITLLIDEAWDLLHGEGSAAFIEGLARRARKYSGNIITGTQSVNDYYKTPATLAAFENTDWIVLLAQKKESVEMLAQTKKVAMDDSFKQALTSLRMVDHQYSEALIYGPQGYAVGRLILDPYSIALYSSKAADWAKINDLTAEGYSLEDALEKIAEEKAKQQRIRLLDYKDYQEMLKQKDDSSFEDALEGVVKQKLLMIFPEAAKKFYYQK